MLTPLRSTSQLGRRSRRRRDAHVAAALVCERLEDRALMDVAAVYQAMFADALDLAPAAPAQAPAILAQWQPNGSFADLDYRGRSNLSGDHYLIAADRLAILARAYHWDDPGNAYFRSPELRAQLVTSWTYLANAPGASRTPNWWYGQLGMPRQMSPGLILMANELGAPLTAKIVQKYFTAARVWTGNYGTGANLLDKAVGGMTEAVLRNRPEMIRDVVARASREIIKTTGEGIMADLSFRQHGNQWYSGSYGINFARSAANLMEWVQGTEFAFGPAAVEREVSYVLDHLQWLLRGDLMEVSVQGRSIARQNSANLRALWVRDLAAELIVNGHRADELQALVNRHDFGVDDQNHLHGNKGLWVADGMLHQRRDWMTGLRLSSARNAGPETLNGENTKGGLLGDGMYTLLRDGDEYGTDPIAQIYPVWDWRRLPGVTAEQPANGAIPRGGSTSAFVGTASDGEYGLAAMDYVKRGRGLSARKAYFFFDDEMVALGADIKGNTRGAPVYTSINQVIQDGDVTVRDAGGQVHVLTGEQSLTLADPAWIAHDGFGYVPLGGNGNLTVQAVTQTGDWRDIGTHRGQVSLPVFSAWIDHGANPAGKTYAYSVVGQASADSLDAYVAASPIRVLANTAAVQAVRHNGLSLTQIVFYKAGSLAISPELTVTVNQPVLVMVKEGPAGLEITTSDPTHRLGAVEIRVNQRLVGAGAQWREAEGVTRIRLTLPTGQLAGSSITRSYAALIGEPTSIAATQDAYVRDGRSKTQNFGAGPSLNVHNDYNRENQRESLLQFDLTGQTGTVLQASLKLVALGVGRAGEVAVAEVANDAWNELSLTWANKPASTGELAREHVARAGQVIALDVTTAVQNAVTGDGLLSLRLFSAAAKNYRGLFTFGAREAAVGLAPVLEIYFAPP